MDILGVSGYLQCLVVDLKVNQFKRGRGSSVVELWIRSERFRVRTSRPPYRHFKVPKVLVNTQEAMAPSQNDGKNC